MDEELLKRRERLTDLRGYPASEKPRNGQLRPNNSLAKLSQLLGDHEPSRAA